MQVLCAVKILGGVDPQSDTGIQVFALLSEHARTPTSCSAKTTKSSTRMQRTSRIRPDPDI